MKPVRTAAHVMLASIFVTDGVRRLIDPKPGLATARRVAPLLEKADPRIPSDPATLVRIKAATDIVAGVALASGRFTRPAAAVLAAGLVPSTLADRSYRNLGLLGGLLLAAVDTEGRPSLRRRTATAVDRSQRSVRRTLRTAKREAKIAALSASAARKIPG